MKKAECPIASVAILLSDTWTILLIRDLLRKPMRFCELERSLVGISTRTLALKLKRLKEKEVMIKTAKGNYQLSKKGKGMRAIIEAMDRYGQRHA